jgi:hypothetical protein
MDVTAFNLVDWYQHLEEPADFVLRVLFYPEEGAADFSKVMVSIILHDVILKTAIFKP